MSTLRSVDDLALSDRSKRILNKAEGKNANEFFARLACMIEDHRNGDEEGLPHLFASKRDTYIAAPMLDHIDRHGFGPDLQEAFPFFSNSLLPETSGPGARTRPKERLTRIGALVMTLEWDGVNPADVDRQVAWCDGSRRNPGLMDQFGDRLKGYVDYRGFCAVYTGNKSLHIHTLWDATHLHRERWLTTESKAGAYWDGRGDVLPDQIPVLHKIAWGKLAGIASEVFGRDVQWDPAMASYYQRRRTPWGVRVYEGDDNMHGFAGGDSLPQIVLAETMLAKAPYGSSDVLLDASVLADLPPPSRTRSRSVPTGPVHGMVPALTDYLRSIWGEYPKPAYLTNDGVERVLHLHNDPSDRHPSSVITGDSRRMLGLGRGAPKDGPWLPGGLTLDETLALIQGGHGASKAPTGHRLMLGPQRRYEAARTIQEARDVAGEILTDIGGQSGTKLVQAPEGLGKTHALFASAADMRIEDMAAAYDPMTGGHGLYLIACKCYDAAGDKAVELRRITNRPVIVLKSTTRLYDEARADLDVDAITSCAAGRQGYGSWLAAVAADQPGVYRRMCELRDDQWRGADGQVRYHDDAYVVTVHGVLRHWTTSRTSRAFLHPAFPADFDAAKIDACLADLKVYRAVYDEVSVDDLTIVRDHGMVQWAHVVAASCETSWSKATLPERVAAYDAVYEDEDDPSYTAVDDILSQRFRDDDEIVLDLLKDRIGTGTDSANIYTKATGKRLHVALRRWVGSLPCPTTILTTEDLPRMVFAQAGAGKVYNLMRTDAVPAEVVPMTMDVRARSDRSDGKPGVVDLATELLDVVDHVIADKLDGLDPALADRTCTVVGARGRNDLASASIATVLACPKDTLHEETTAIGQRYGIGGATKIAYRDRLNQALGRNIGFRRRGDGDVHRVVLHPKIAAWWSSPPAGASPDRYVLRLVGARLGDATGGS